MSEMFDAKLRKVGNSRGIIIPKDIIDDLGIRSGDVIHVVIPSTDLDKRNELLRELAGIYKAKSGFRREKEDRY